MLLTRDARDILKGLENLKSKLLANFCKALKANIDRLHALNFFKKIDVSQCLCNIYFEHLIACHCFQKKLDFGFSVF